MTRARAVLLVVVVSLGAYANSLGNGFAYDDHGIVGRNPVVHEMDWERIVGGPWWPELGGDGLYRPVTTALLSVQWAAWGDRPAAFHGVNVAAHTGVSLLVLGLLLHFLPVIPAAVGGVLFAVHPVHTEAVANVVGQAEIFAALFALAACWLFVAVRPAGGAGRGLRVAALAFLYLMALGAKEIAVTLPGLLLLLAWWQSRSGEEDGGPGPWRRFYDRAVDELPVWIVLPPVLGAFLAFRMEALGGLLGAGTAPALVPVDGVERVYTSFSLWPEYARLLLFPFDLVAEYQPAVLFPALALTPEVFAGALLLVAVGALAWIARDEAPGVTVGLAWIALGLLPVSHLLFRVGTLLAERTFYLPSAGLSLAVAGGAALVLPRLDSRRLRQGALAGAVVVFVAFFVRTVTRNPTWFSTFSVFEALAEEHPESYLAHKTRAMGLTRVGQFEAAADAYEAALALVPTHPGLLVEVADFYGDRREWEKAEPLLHRAVAANPHGPVPHRHLASQLLLQGRFREGHRAALRGLSLAGSDAELWSLVSESYIAKGDLAAAARARRAALAADAERRKDWLRLAEILERSGRPDEAARARARAQSLPEDGTP